MFVKRVYAKNFRNFSEIVVDFIDGANFIVGDNGRGKTTLLEALFFCITGSSFRTQHLKELIRFGESGFFVEVLFVKGEVTHTLHITYDGSQRRLFFNHAPCESLATLLGLMPGVACTPEDIELVQGAPAVRRRFLDVQLAQIDAHYVHHLRRYIRALKQRNVLLKTTKDHSLLGCFEKELATSGAYLIAKRKVAAEFLQNNASSYFKAFCPGTELSLSYSSTYKEYDTVDMLRAYLEQEYVKKRGHEIDMGTTLVGPHRDDLDIRFNGKLARDFASIGQRRLIAQALRLAEWYFLKTSLNEEPLMIVDDFATSLDEKKEHLLAEELSKLGQVFLSSTEMLRNKLANKTSFVLELGDAGVALPARYNN